MDPVPDVRVKELYGAIWGYVGLYGAIWGYMGLYGAIWGYMDPALTVGGYAWSGGGRGIIRVDVSADGGACVGPVRV